MQPTIYNIRYYEGDSFTISVYPQDSTGAAIDLKDAVGYFRLAEKRDDPTGWTDRGTASIMQLTLGSPLCIKCDMSSQTGQYIKNGYVYDIGYTLDGHRVTVLTGAFQVMGEVKTSGST